MEFEIEDPLKKKFVEKLRKDKFRSANYLVRRNPDLLKYDYSEEIREVLKDGKEKAAQNLLIRFPELLNYNYGDVAKEALEKGKLNTVKFILSRNLDISGVSFASALEKALKEGDKTLYKFILDNKLDISDLNFGSALQYLRRQGNYRTIEFIKKNFDVSGVELKPYTLKDIKYAIQLEDFEIADQILEENPSLLEADLTDFFIDNRNSPNITKYILDKEFPIPTNIALKVTSNQLWTTIGRIMR